MKTLRRLVGSSLRFVRRFIDLQIGIMFERGRSIFEGESLVEELQQSDGRPPMLSAGRLQRFSEGHRRFAITENDEVLADAWVAQQVSSVKLIMDVPLKLPPNAVYIWDCQTRPEFRRRGLYTQLLSRIPEQLDVAQVFVAVDAANTPSRAGVANAGYREKFRYSALRIGTKTIFAVAFRGIKIIGLKRFLTEFSEGATAP